MDRTIRFPNAVVAQSSIDAMAKNACGMVDFGDIFAMPDADNPGGVAVIVRTREVSPDTIIEAFLGANSP